MRKTVWLLLLLLPRLAAAQPAGLADSLALLAQYQRAGPPAAAERVATGLLARYPGRVPAGTATYPNYPQAVYAARAQARTGRGNFRGAEADLGQALRYADRVAADARFYRYDGPQVQLLREAYYARALLRLDHLRDRAGGCADLAAAYQHDTVVARSRHWRGCPLPATRLPLDGAFGRARLLAQDSLAQLRYYLAARRTGHAGRLLAQLRAGRVGPYTYAAGVGLAAPPQGQPSQSLAFLLSQVLAQQGRFARARAVLDSLAATPDSLFYRYQRGVFLIDNGLDQAAGCQDLRWVYDHDSTRTGPAHPRWRGCPLPRYKVPYGPVESDSYYLAYHDSTERARRLVAAGRPAPAARLLTQLLTTAQAGRYALPVPTDNGVPPAPQSPAYLVNVYPRRRTAREVRLSAHLALADYARAEAELDTLIRYFRRPKDDYHCRRGQLRADFLNNPAGACEDLRACYQAGLQPPGRNPWRGCDVLPPPVAKTYANDTSFDPFTDLTEGVWQGGLFRQGTLTGVQASRMLASSDVALDDFFRGVSAGLDISGNQTDFMVAPKLSYEVALVLLGSRLDLSYNLNQKLRGDLRLTPQAGLTLGGLLNLYYGYAFHLAGTELDALGNHRISLYINFLRFPKLGG